ncbi:MAG: hypothetical protein JXJ04_06755, partial [Spirochaetales bacterium]|nr:hypothetical protein [Spirochaetales bacterium]
SIKKSSSLILYNTRSYIGEHFGKKISVLLPVQLYHYDTFWGKTTFIRVICHLKFMAKRNFTMDGNGLFPDT